MLRDQINFLPHPDSFRSDGPFLPGLCPGVEGREDPGLHGEFEPDWLALVLRLRGRAQLIMVSASHAAVCVSAAEEAPAPESKEVSESLPHDGEQLNPGVPRVEV